VAGENVKRIFWWKLEGMSNRRIAERLNALGVLAPADYKRSLGIHYKSGFQKNLTSGWSAAAVGRILSNPLCKGLVVQGKHGRINHKMKKMVAKPESEQSRFMQEDLVYGLARKQDVRENRTGSVIFPMYSLKIQGDDGDVLKTYRKDGAYVVDIIVLIICLVFIT